MSLITDLFSGLLRKVLVISFVLYSTAIRRLSLHFY